jgi:hypothetical protein
MEILWEKIQFWKKSKRVEYRFQQSPIDDSTWVEITSGKYAGVIYSYGFVKIDHEIGIPKLNFNYNVIHFGNFKTNDLFNNEEFVTVMGDILTEIIIENEPTRNNNPEELDLQ